MQSLKDEVEKLRGNLENAKKNMGQSEGRQDDTQAKEEERRERKDRDEKLEWELELIQRRSRRRNVITEEIGQDQNKERREVEK